MGNLKSVTLTIPWNFLQSLWRSFLESLYVDTTQIGNKWDCWESSTQSERRYVCSIVAIRSGWEMVGRFHGMPYLSAKCYRSLVWWENTTRKTLWRTFWRTNHSVWFIGWVLPYLCEGPVKNPSIWKKKSYLDVPRIRSVRGRNLEGWHTGCRPWGVGNDGRIWNLPEKTQCKRGDISERKWNIYFSSRRWTNQTSWRRSETENVHLDTGSPNSRRRSKRFSRRIRRVSTTTTSRLKTGCRWSTKWFLVHFRKLHKPRSRWTKSQTLLADRRIIPYSTVIHWRLQNCTYKFGC